MAIKLSFEQADYCLGALGDVLDTGKTERKCPICGKSLEATMSGNSGEVRCETENCFGTLTLRGI